MVEPERRSSGTRQDVRPKLPWPKDRRFKILSIDGGGIRGILPASVLAQLEQRYLRGASVADYFDLIAGTSTGGIIALGLGLGMSGADVLRLYLENGAKIFPAPLDLSFVPGIELARDAWRFVSDLRRYRYDRKPLQDALAHAFGSKLFGESRRRLVVPAFDGFGEVTVFKTPHHADFKKDHLRTMVDVALATAAAPTFFSTYESGDRHFADGGVWAANPVMLALVEALTAYDVRREDVDVLSLGCADGEFSITKEQTLRGGLWHWREIFTAASYLQSQNALGQAGLLIGRNHLLRVDHKPLGRPLPIDDFALCSAKLPPIATSLVEESGDKIRDIFLGATTPDYPAYYGPRSGAA